MKALLSSAAMAVSVLGLASLASAQINVQSAPIHAVPAEHIGTASEMAQAALTPPPSAMQMIVQVPVAAAVPVRLNADENAFFAALGKRLTDSAAAYETYMRRAGALDGRFADPPSVQRALLIGENYDSQQLQEGAVAYSAMLALRHSAFVAGVKAADPALLDRLAAEPQLVLQIKGADEAAADVSGVLRRQAQVLSAASTATARAAFDVQQQSWSTLPMDAPEKVLANAKAPRHITAVAEDERALLDSIVGTPRTSAVVKPVVEADEEGALLHSIVATSVVSTASGPAPVVTRGLAAAALAVAGRAGDANEAALEPLLKDQPCDECLNLAKADLNQCLAVAGPNYEGVFCLGKHALGETAGCLIAALDAQPLSPAAPVAPTSVARAAFKTPGPEEAAAYGLKPSTDESLPPEEQVDSAPLAEAPPPAASPGLTAEDDQVQAPPPQQTRRQAQRAYGYAPYGYAPYGYNGSPQGYAQPPATYPRSYAQPYGGGGVN